MTQTTWKTLRPHHRTSSNQPGSSALFLGPSKQTSFEEKHILTIGSIQRVFPKASTTLASCIFPTILWWMYLVTWNKVLLSSTEALGQQLVLCMLSGTQTSCTLHLLLLTAPWLWACVSLLSYQSCSRVEPGRAGIPRCRNCPRPHVRSEKRRGLCLWTCNGVSHYGWWTQLLYQPSVYLQHLEVSFLDSSVSQVVL